MAAPHVAGVVALVWSKYPQMSWEAVRDKIFWTVRPVESLVCKTRYEGVVNAWAALDCNFNGIPDDEDITGGTSQDCTGNWIPDECEPDCNGNGVADTCDIASGASQDVNGDGIPDECPPPECESDEVRDCCYDDGLTCENFVWNQDCVLSGGAPVDNCGLPPGYSGFCCLPNGACDSDIIYGCCETLGGTSFIGSCDSAGACCPPGAAGECVFTNETCCDAVGGTFHFLVQCAPDLCEVGGCCSPDGSICQEDVFKSDCLASDELYLGGGQECTENASTVCCLADETCGASVHDACCAALGGTLTAADSCSPLGACCPPLESGGGECFDTIESCCDAIGGSFCAESVCNPPGLPRINCPVTAQSSPCP